MNVNRYNGKTNVKRSKKNIYETLIFLTKKCYILGSPSGESAEWFPASMSVGTGKKRKAYRYLKLNPAPTSAVTDRL